MVIAMSEIENYNKTTFEAIKHLNEFGSEYWNARELAQVLEYKQWRNFEAVIDRAKTACKESGNSTEDHFAGVSKTINMPKGAVKDINDYELSRYACYLIVQNGDSRKKVIAFGQTYFAVQTRKQELQEQFEQLSENRKRISIRNELKEHNKDLVDAAKEAGVKTEIDYAVFQNHGYQGLYGGLTAKEIHAKKGLKKSHKILDFMGSTELAANLFRATQAEDKLRRENIQGKNQANLAHFEVGQIVRSTIKELGGTMPENLPTPQKSIQSIENELERSALREVEFLRTKT
jgi:DNA-damage-inducible protein D